jgi:hypothetical protein
MSHEQLCILFITSLNSTLFLTDCAIVCEVFFMTYLFFIIHDFFLNALINLILVFIRFDK